MAERYAKRKRYSFAKVSIWMEGHARTLLSKARVVTCDGTVCLSIFNSHIQSVRVFFFVCVVRMGY